MYTGKIDTLDYLTDEQLWKQLGEVNDRDRELHLGLERNRERGARLVHAIHLRGLQ